MSDITWLWGYAVIRCCLTDRFAGSDERVVMIPALSIRMLESSNRRRNGRRTCSQYPLNEWIFGWKYHVLKMAIFAKCGA